MSGGELVEYSAEWWMVAVWLLTCGLCCVGLVFTVIPWGVGEAIAKLRRECKGMGWFKKESERTAGMYIGAKLYFVPESLVNIFSSILYRLDRLEDAPVVEYVECEVCGCMLMKGTRASCEEEGVQVQKGKQRKVSVNTGSRQ